jgi:hypothetical protein
MTNVGHKGTFFGWIVLPIPAIGSNRRKVQIWDTILRSVNIPASIVNRTVMEQQKKETEVKYCSRQYKRTLILAERMLGCPTHSQGLV